MQTLVAVSPEELGLLIRDAVASALAGQSKEVGRPNSNAVLTFDEVRLRLRLSAPTVRRLIRAGRLAAQRSGRRWLFSQSAVDAFIAGGQP